ncbi:MAG TPA: hypothetical protein PKE06_17250, partial [Flavilitoribacter sp.]|nr:hypothetical protein [Flavilitoribacter sp.]
GEGQEKAMSEWNALGAAAYANRFYGKPFDLNQNWEWLHVRGAQIGGKTLNSNLVAGLYAVNSQMIPYENKIKEMDKKDPGKLKARFYTEGHITGPFAEKINIDIATNGPHAVFGNIPDSKPVSLSFYTTSGKVVDKMMGYIEAFKLDQLVEKNVKGLASPEENRRALVPSYQAHREDVSARFQESLGRSPSSPFMFPSGGMPFPKPEMPSGLGSFGSEIVPVGRPFGDSPFVITPPMNFEFMVPEGFNLFNPTNFEFLNRFMAQVPQHVGLLIETEEGGRLTQTFLGGTRQQSPPEDSSDQSGSFRGRTNTFIKSMLEKSRKLAIGINPQSLVISRAKQHSFKMRVRFMIQQQKQGKGAIVRPFEGFNDK